MVADPLPPSVGGLRAINTWRVLRDPFGTYAEWQAKYGDTYFVPAINGDVVVTADPQVVRDLFRADSTQVEPFGVEAAAPLVGRQSLLLLSGDAHRRERKLLMPPFHGARMRTYGELIGSIAARQVSELQVGAEFSAAEVMREVSLEVIVQAVFGVREARRVHQWAAAITPLIDGMHPALVFMPRLQNALVPPWRRFVAARAALDALLYAEIEARRRQPEGDDILSMLVASTYEDGSPMSDTGIRDELVTLLFAGHETTQIAMAWALYRLARAPEVLAAVHEEVDACDGSPEALNKLPLLDGVVREALRIEPVVPDLVRTLSVDMQLGPWSFRAGTHICPAAALVHMNAEVFPEPAAFRPARYQDRSPKPWEYLPFGGGVRRCIGAALATYEMKVVLGTWLRAVELQSVRDDHSVRRNITMGSRYGVPMRVVRLRQQRAAA